MDNWKIIEAKCDEKNLEKLKQIKNTHLTEFIAKFVDLMGPDSIFVCDGSYADYDYIREKALKDGEEEKLAKKGHTIHFDSIYDQARDKKRTKFLVPEGASFGKGLNIADKTEGLKDIQEIMSGIMKGRELLIIFFTLGPQNSKGLRALSFRRWLCSGNPHRYGIGGSLYGF